MNQAIAIIPNEYLLCVPPYYKDLVENDRHGKGILKFSNCLKEIYEYVNDNVNLFESEELKR